MFALPAAKSKTAARSPEGPGRWLPPQLGFGLVQRAASWDFGDTPATAKLVVGRPDDATEEEAHRVAAQVMRFPEPSRSTAGAAAQPPPMQAPSATGWTADHAAGVREALKSPGHQLDASTRGFFEARLGSDFGRVRVRTDENAARSARSLNAVAYTLGEDIVFAQGRYEPALAHGRAILAHELVHVAQQANGARVLARQTVEQYQTTAVTLDVSEFEKSARASYWEQKVLREFELAADARMNTNAEERDAVLAVLWQVRPKVAVTSETTRLVKIPKRSATTSDLMYQFTFAPRTNPTAKDRAQARFVTEGAGATPVAASALPAGTAAPPKPSRREGGFPQNNAVEEYWKAHPEEQTRLFQWVQTAAQTFDQAVTVTTSAKGATRTTTFHLKGAKDTSGDVSDLTITFAGATAPTTEAVADPKYAAHDFADLEIEDAQSKADPKQHDKLGTINGMSSAPADEQLSVKLAIWNYFRSGTRNAEVDAIVPIANLAKRVLYTFRFRPKSNDVDVERIGEEGQDVSLEPKGNLGRVSGFSAHSKDVSTLTAWLKTRYPGVTPTGQTVAEVQANVTAEIAAKSGTPAWYKTNYAIDVLDATAAAARLTSAHGYGPLQVADMQDFTATDLPVLELAIETMGDALVLTLRGLRIARQKISIEKEGQQFDPKPGRTGITLTKGADRTIIIFDAAAMNAGDLFLGGAGTAGAPAAVSVETTMTFEHEIGHTVADQPSMQKAFDDYVKARAAKGKPIKPITWYAASKPATELFPEAFALYQSDPAFLKQNSPDLYTWFDTLNQTGKPPPP